ncbi:hypothetical protein [Pyxidicoccus xibeiensis]|uniref:hypothetical protein n=1 Tax=Pyxidicoccus xibeiensis TaxID=2906759 RepID=UPI0020A7DDEA|nr:hypothetical protein [Pyxidicoccus xibeiensis]MCP3138298.1 hypothetical protein [Pyxidicoccus xibeiensis]
MIRAATLALLLCSCATSSEGLRMGNDGTPEGRRPLRKGDPEPVFEFEPGPPVTDTPGLKTWLEAHRGERLRLPVVIELGEPGHRFERSRVGDVELRVTDLALGVPLDERIAQKCGREARRCALWLEGRYGETPPFPDDLPQYEVLKVGEVVDEKAELKAERAK